MTLSTEATKYRDEFVKAAHAAGEKVGAREYKNDLELIKEINRAIDELKHVRGKHVQQ